MNIILITSIGLITFYQEVNASQGSDEGSTFLQHPSAPSAKKIVGEEDEKDRKEGEAPSPDSTPLCSPLAGGIQVPDSPPPLSVLGKDGKWRAQIKTSDGKWVNAPEE